jgi:hypothetical protein
MWWPSCTLLFSLGEGKQMIYNLTNFIPAHVLPDKQLTGKSI